MLTPLKSAFCWSISTEAAATAGIVASASLAISIGVPTCVWLLLFFTVSQLLLLLLLIATDVVLLLKFSCCCWLKLQFSTLWFPHDEDDDGDMVVACSIIDEAVSHVNESHPRLCSCASSVLVLLLLLLLPFFCVDRACISHFCSCLISSWWS